MEASILLPDAIFYRMHCTESMTKHGSTFSLDLQQVASMMALASPRSLILLDEFGKGTDVCGNAAFYRRSHSRADGLGLLAALIRHFAAMGERCPRILLTSHYQGCACRSRRSYSKREHLVELVGNLEQVSFGHMLAMKDDNVDGVMLFRACPGYASYTMPKASCAESGIPEEVIERGRVSSQRG